MKVYEKINQLKGTNADLDLIVDWGYHNRICPITMDAGLELDENEYPTQLHIHAQKMCQSHIAENCGIDCMTDFLNEEYDETLQGLEEW